MVTDDHTSSLERERGRGSELGSAGEGGTQPIVRPSFVVFLDVADGSLC